jgi:hypothetical protein
MAAEGVHFVGLLEGTGVESLECRSSPAAATIIIYLTLKIRRKEDQTNRAVNHNLWNVMRNKARKTSDFPNRNKLQNVPIIKESQIRVYMYLYTCFCTYAIMPIAGVTNGLVPFQTVRT